jgi:predicted permease
MSEILMTTVSQMTVLFGLIIIGYVLAKLKAVPENSSAVLSKMENNLFVPALVMGTFMEQFTVEKITVAWKLLLVSAVICLFMIALAILLAKCCSKDSYIRNIYTYGLAFSNFGFMGNAVVKVVFPELFLEYLIFVLPLWTMIYLWGVPCLLIPSEGGKQTFKNRMKSFVNPMFISMVIGILIGLSGWKLPTPITTVVNTAGDCMSPIAMLLTGMTVAKMDAKKILSMKSIYAVSLIRLVLFPMIFIGFFYVVPMSTTTVVCTICSLAMPLGLSTLVIPSGYGKDTSVAAGMAIVSHLLAVITIPIVFFIMMKVLL